MRHATASTSASLKIDSVEVVALDIVPRRRRAMSTGPYAYSDKGGWAGRPLLVGIHADGLTGWGEVRPINPFVGETAASMFSNVRDFYGPALIGRNAMEIEAILRDCERKLPNNPAALATIDMALHDVVGKALDVPAHALLGGACKSEIPLEWSVGLNTESAMVAEAADVADKYGVRFVCIKIGPSRQLDKDLRTAHAIQKALGSRIHLGVDANTTYDVVSAVHFAQRTADAGLTYFEQPVPRTDLAGMRRIRDKVSVPIMADESVFTLDDAMRVVSAQAADVLATKFYKCGGLRRCRDIAVIAEAGGINANCAGTANGSYIEAIAAAHLCATIPNHAFGAEFIMGLPSVDEDLIVANRPIDVKDGMCNVPQGPGLGFDIDLKAVAKFALERVRVDAAGARRVDH